MTILQSTVADAERGRVMAVLQAVMSAASVLSMGLAGIAGDAIGVRAVFFAAGAICAVGFVVALVGFRPRGSARDAAEVPDGEAVTTGLPAA